MSKKLIFDLDGTLLFLSNDWEPAYQAFIDKFNLKITPKDLFSCIGTFELNNSDIIVTKKILCDYINSRLNIILTEEMLNELNKYYNNIPLLDTDKIYDLLEYLSSKYELFAYSNWFTEEQEYRLERYDLKKFFKKVYGWDIIPLKPSKEGPLQITNGNIDDYIMIGDTIETDILIPNSLGMETIFYNRKNIEQNKYKEIKTIYELKEIL